MNPKFQMLHRSFGSKIFCSNTNFAALALCSYYVLKTHVGPNSLIVNYDSWNVEAPYLFRWLIPQTLTATLPLDWLDATALRIALATLFVMVALRLMPDFLTRITATRLTPQSATRIQWMLLLMLLAHYILPRNLKFYYVYDLPSITFYLMAFLALTSPHTRTRWLGVLITGALSTNRETIGVAVVHAAAWHAMQWAAQQPRDAAKLLQRWAPCVFATVAVLAVRQATVMWLDHPPQSSFSWMEGDQWRIIANLERMATKHHHGIALLWFGAGAIIWLPRKWRQLPPMIKAMLVASLPVFLFFCVVGNFVELRMFNELLPVLAAALAFKATTDSSTSPRRPHG